MLHDGKCSRNYFKITHFSFFKGYTLMTVHCAVLMVLDMFNGHMEAAKTSSKKTIQKSCHRPA